jgi:hypothetical protein
MSAKGFSLGHNSGDIFIDPGPANDYVDRGPIAQYPQFDRVAVSAFYNAVRSQGEDEVRHRAVDLAFERARENAALSAQALRLYHRICQNNHGSYRYSTEPHERLAAYCSFASATNFHRYIRELLDLGFLARFELHRHGGGHPYPIYTVVCTADDRSGLTAELLRRKALARRVSPTVPKAIIDDEQVIEAASIRQSDELQPIVSESIRHTDVSQNVDVTYRGADTSERRIAIRQSDDPNLRTIISSNITTVGKEDRGCGGDTSPSARSTIGPTVNVEFEDIDSPASVQAFPQIDATKLKPASKSKTSASRDTMRGTRLRDDWELPERWRVWALSEFAVDAHTVRVTSDSFRDYWCALPGARGVKLDWEATWRNWCRRSGWKCRPDNYPADDLISEAKRPRTVDDLYGWRPPS